MFGAFSLILPFFLKNQNMQKLFIICLLVISLNCFGQKIKLTKNDWHTIVTQIPIGYLQGVRDQVIYHPVQLFKKFPNLNRNFWDIRLQGERGFLNMQWDADHIFKSAIISGEVVLIAFKIGEKTTIKKVILNIIANYLSYKLGFFLSYNVTFKNKL